MHACACVYVYVYVCVRVYVRVLRAFSVVGLVPSEIADA